MTTDYMTTGACSAPKPERSQPAAKRARSGSNRMAMVTMATDRARMAMVTMAKCLQRFGQHGYGDY
jgi:hypothetical protein